MGFVCGLGQRTAITALMDEEVFQIENSEDAVLVQGIFRCMRSVRREMGRVEVQAAGVRLVHESRKDRIRSLTSKVGHADVHFLDYVVNVLTVSCHFRQ